MVAFLGHAAESEPPETCATSAACEATGLKFFDKSLVKAPYSDKRDEGLPPTAWRFTDQVGASDIVPVGAKVVFVGACRLGEVFRSLWAIDESPTQALIVPTVKETYLGHASAAMLAISDRLAQGQSVYDAVVYANTVTLKDVALKFSVLGGNQGRDVYVK